MTYSILKIIARIRDSFPAAEKVYTQGSCVKFAMILKEIFPNGQILYDQDHAIFQLGKQCYDITGIVSKNDHHRPLEEYDILEAYDFMNLKYEG